jgi:hypothetical protein
MCLLIFWERTFSVLTTEFRQQSTRTLVAPLGEWAIWAV